MSLTGPSHAEALAEDWEDEWAKVVAERDATLKRVAELEASNEVLVKALKLAEKLSVSNDKCVQCDSDFAADFGITGELSHQLHCPFAVLSTLPEQASELLADRDRLDWLDEAPDQWCGLTGWIGPGTLRAAIDAARASEKGE